MNPKNSKRLDSLFAALENLHQFFLFPDVIHSLFFSSFLWHPTQSGPPLEYIRQSKVFLFGYTQEFSKTSSVILSNISMASG